MFDSYNGVAEEEGLHTVSILRFPIDDIKQLFLDLLCLNEPTSPDITGSPSMRRSPEILGVVQFAIV